MATGVLRSNVVEISTTRLNCVKMRMLINSIFFFRQRTFTVCEVLDAIKEGVDFGDVAGIAIEPPEVHAETDEDSRDDESNPDAANRLTGFQLRAQAHLLRRNHDSDDDSDCEDPNEQRQLQLAPRPKKKKPNVVYVFHRVAKCPSRALPIFPPGNFSAYRDMSPVELFELFWDETLVEDILEQIKIYSTWKGKEVVILSNAEFRTFLGIILLSGYKKLPQGKLYWSQDMDLGNNLAQSSMRKNKFEQTMQFLYFTDNSSLDENDKYCKLRSLITHLQKNFG